MLGPAIFFAIDRIAGMSNDMSGRDIIWPYFLEAIEARPLFGFGLGAGKLIVNPEDPTISLLGSNAAHNEYLRLSVDAGIIGCAAIFISIILWVWSGANGGPGGPVGDAGCAARGLVHSGFDNTLIASTALIQFCFFYAAMARAQDRPAGNVDAPPDAAWPAGRQGRRKAVMSAALARQAPATAECRHAARPGGGAAGARPPA